MKSPDYGFTEGLTIERKTHLTPDWHSQENIGNAEALGLPRDTSQPDSRLQIATSEEIQELSRDPYSGEHAGRVVEQLKNPRYIRSLGGVGFEAAVVGNPDAEEVKIVFYGWGGNFRHPNAQREAITMTYANPGVAYVVMNGPGVGNSGMLPESAQKEIRKTGSYLPLGEYLAPVVDHVAQDYKAVDLGGHSLGARTATAVVANREGSTEELRLYDPTGTRKTSLGGIATGFFLGEGRELMKYDKASSVPKPGDVGLEFLSQNDPDSIEAIAGLSDGAAGEFKRPESGWIQQFLVDPAGLRRDGFEGDLRVAAPNVERRVDILVPDGSHLNDWRDVAMIVGRLRSVPGLTADVSQWNVLNHTHNSMNQPPALASVYAAELS